MSEPTKIAYPPEALPLTVEEPTMMRCYEDGCINHAETDLVGSKVPDGWTRISALTGKAKLSIVMYCPEHEPTVDGGSRTIKEATLAVDEGWRARIEYEPEDIWVNAMTLVGGLNDDQALGLGRDVEMFLRNSGYRPKGALGRHEREVHIRVHSS